MVYFSSAWRCSSAFSDCTFSPPRMFSIAASMRLLSAPAAFSAAPSSPLSSSAASTNSSLAMKASPRCCASLSVTLSRRLRSLPTLRLPSCPVTFGSWSSASPRRVRSAATLTPACASSGAVEPPCWSSSARSRCTGSIRLWSRPTASDCASASACWKREVSLSMRMTGQPFLVGHTRRWLRGWSCRGSGKPLPARPEMGRVGAFFKEPRAPAADRRRDRPVVRRMRCARSDSQTAP